MLNNRIKLVTKIFIGDSGQTGYSADLMAISDKKAQDNFVLGFNDQRPGRTPTDLLNFFVGDGFDICLGNLCHVFLEVLNVIPVGDETRFDQTVVDATVA